MIIEDRTELWLELELAQNEYKKETEDLQKELEEMRDRAHRAEYELEEQKDLVEDLQGQVDDHQRDEDRVRAAEQTQTTLIALFEDIRRTMIKNSPSELFRACWGSSHIYSDPPLMLHDFLEITKVS